MPLDGVIGVAIAYLLYTLTLAGAVQVAINQIKPLLLNPLREWLTMSDTGYLVFIYFVRSIVTALAYFYVWGGVEATRATVPLLPVAIPDTGVAVGTIFIVVLGEEVIHPLVERLYLLRDAAKQLQINPPQG